jgi:hypothetical protein
MRRPHVSHRRVGQIGPRLEYLCRTTDLLPPTPGGRNDPGSLGGVRAQVGQAPAGRVPAGRVKAEAIDRPRVQAALAPDDRVLVQQPAREARTAGLTDHAGTEPDPAVRDRPVVRSRVATTAMDGDLDLQDGVRPGATHHDGTREPCPPRMAIVRVGTTRRGPVLNLAAGPAGDQLADRLGVATAFHHAASSRNGRQHRSDRWR